MRTAIALLHAGAKPTEDPVLGPLPEWTKSEASWDFEVIAAKLDADMKPAGKKGKGKKGGGGKKKK